MSETEAHSETKLGSERSFGLVFGAVFAIIGLLPLLNDAPMRIWALGGAAVFVLLGFLYPRALRPLNLLWFKFGMLLGRIIAPIVMMLLFFVVVTPVALIMRALGKDVLRLKIDRDAPSYWIRRSDDESPMGSMKNQF